MARSYVDLTMWTSLVSHTTTTIRRGRESLKSFDNERKVSAVSCLCKVEKNADHITQKYALIFPEKKWDFPKAHSQSHIFDNIEDTGVIANSSTKGFEKMHHKPKIVWQKSNFRDLEQIVRISMGRVTPAVSADCKYAMQTAFPIYDARDRCYDHSQSHPDIRCRSSGAEDAGRNRRCARGSSGRRLYTGLRVGAVTNSGPMGESRSTHIGYQALVACWQLRSIIS